ncbi:MAG: hypothetical protein ACR2G0_05020 [Chthoniobacterales bacterium]
MRAYLTAVVLLGVAALPLLSGNAQAPAPVIIQAVTPAPVSVVAPPPAAAAAPVTDLQASTMQQLQEMRTTNAETIKKQEAALATLDELQKAAEEIKIYSKRG